MKILITGSAGFIGFHLAQTLLNQNNGLTESIEITGIDDLNNYYEVSLKEARLSLLQTYKNFHFIKADISEAGAIDQLFTEHTFDVVVHLSAQAGVRHSLENPQSHIQSNIVAFGYLLTACSQYKVKHLIYASSSSVYGGNTKLPFSEEDFVDHPVSIYAATKKSNELMAHVYSHVYQLPTTGLRFFTVYGPWGRPDMSPFLFANAILTNKTLKVFNYGDMVRDFTYIDDIISGVIRLINKPPAQTPPYNIFNIGNHTAVPLLEFIGTMEEILGKTANKEFLPMPAGDVKATYADTDKLRAYTDFAPSTPLKEGLTKFLTWYRAYYGV